MLWNATYATGVPIMDQQHQELFRQIDILLDPGQAGRVESTLDFLGNYVVKHFSTEEGLQMKSRYPDYAAHKKIHDNFVATYKGLRKEYDTSGQSPVVLMKVSKAALDWLKTHIRVKDKEFAQYYKQHATV